MVGGGGGAEETLLCFYQCFDLQELTVENFSGHRQQYYLLIVVDQPAVKGIATGTGTNASHKTLNPLAPLLHFFFLIFKYVF